jgi:hypothetical protein
MNQPLSEHIDKLKSALLLLPATGETGFEGLIGTALREISGVPFRLAGSGYQFGVDGKSAYAEDAICFEGKRYKGNIPREAILTKIADLSIHDNETDIWVLGATSPITTQLADDARKLGDQNGIFVLILDWSATDLPPLAVALAMGRTRIEEFLEKNIRNDETRRKALAALAAIRESPDFELIACRIRAECNAPAVGSAILQKTNADWLLDAFSNRKQAIVKLGQPLSPGDADTANIRQRTTLIDQLHPYLTAVPDETVVCILGGEGNGKSWIVAQSWLALEHKPLMIYMSPDVFAETARQNDVVSLLTDALIKQTEDQITAVTQQRWRRRLGQWRNHPVTENPRLIVVIDGLNQRPQTDWARIIVHIGDELSQVGGRLIVTARTPYFQNHVKRRLSACFEEILVPEWAEAERDEILVAHGKKPAELHRDVAASLCNPRLLGIALELLDKADIVDLKELSVPRLLFEHIRMSERDATDPQPAHVFAQRLQEDAQEILRRVQAKQQDDLYIFKFKYDDMAAVADGRFFHAVEGDPTRYSLQEEGLTLAFGFAVIDRLRTAQRNGRNLDAALDAILEPIMALDNTADVILAALTVTDVDENSRQDITASLVRGFAGLQNPDQATFRVFSGLTRSHPQGFMDAARMLCLTGNHQPNFDWIQRALINAGKDGNVWPKTMNEVRSWLSVYSLSPERGSSYYLQHDPLEKVQKEREQNRQKIQEKLEALSATERAILESLQETEGDLSSLSRLALLLLAGKKLAPFAKSFLNWSFANALNPDHTAPYKDFLHLIRLNRVDWPKARTALLDVSGGLRDSDVSTTGKEALVNILRATGYPDEDKEAQSLNEALTKDWPRFEGRRHVEDYCATDPCEPASERPENVTRTAQQYTAIDVNTLRQGPGLAIVDAFLSEARPAVARFAPEAAVAKHREFAADVLNRAGFALRWGLLELRKHNALLTIEDARELVKRWAAMQTTDAAGGQSEQDAWMVSQYCLLLAFPFLTAREQAEILLSDEADEKNLLVLMNLVKPLNEAELESLLETACAENDQRRQHLLLRLIKGTAMQLSAGARTHIAALSRSESARVRAQAFRIIAQSGDEELLRQVAASNWTAADADMENGDDVWYGSAALLEATARGLITPHEVLDRISPHLYGRAATIFDADVVRDIARRIDASIEQAAGLGGELVVPDIKLHVLPSVPDGLSQFSMSERPSECNDPIEAFKRLSESSDDLAQRQRRNSNAFLEFKAHLTREKACIILDYLRLEEFEAVVGSDEILADRWYSLFMNIDKKKLPAIHNLVLLLAYALGKKDANKADKLFRRVRSSQPLVQFVFSETGIELDAIASWAGARNPVLDRLRFTRLDQARTDHDLSLEVLAALLNGQHELLTEYIETKLNKEEPAEIARGLMVAGFSDQSEFNDKIIACYEDSAGLIGSAHKAAKYAYERNVWARHWFEHMGQTAENIDFWRYAVLFSKIVDGRFAVWQQSYAQRETPIEWFGASIIDQLDYRYKRWQEHRKKTLFGDDAPTPIFLEYTDMNGD